MSKYLGNFLDNAAVEFKFNTQDSGTRYTLAGTPAISIYKGSATGTETTTGVTLTVDHDSITGMHHVSVVTTNAFYDDAAEYFAVITQGTVNSKNVAGVVVAHWSMQNRVTLGTAAQASNLNDMASDYDSLGYIFAWPYPGSLDNTALAASGIGPVLVRTTIATLASQTSFTLTAGSADNDAYNGCTIIFQDASTAQQKAIGIVSDYTGATKTVTMYAAPGEFTVAATDVVLILAEAVSKEAEYIVINGLSAGTLEMPPLTTGQIRTTSFTAGAIDAAAIGADAIGASELATDAVTEIVAGVWNAVRATYATAGSFGQGAASVQGNVTGSVASVTGNVSGAVGSIASGGITSSTFASGAITATAIAADAITAAKLASDVSTEILSIAPSATFLAAFLTTSTGTTSASAIEGSVAKETADLSSGGGSDLTTLTALAQAGGRVNQ